MEEICDKIKRFQRKGRYDHLYPKAEELRGTTTKTSRTFEIKVSQGNIATNH